MAARLLSLKNRGSVIFEDNTGCIAISQNSVYQQRTKHVSTKYAFLLDYVQFGHVCIEKCHSSDQVADVLWFPLDLRLPC